MIAQTHVVTVCIIVVAMIMEPAYRDVHLDTRQNSVTCVSVFANIDHFMPICTRISFIFFISLKHILFAVHLKFKTDENMSRGLYRYSVSLTMTGLLVKDNFRILNKVDV